MVCLVMIWIKKQVIWWRIEGEKVTFILEAFCRKTSFRLEFPIPAKISRFRSNSGFNISIFYFHVLLVLFQLWVTKFYLWNLGNRLRMVVIWESNAEPRSVRARHAVPSSMELSIFFLLTLIYSLEKPGHEPSYMTGHEERIGIVIFCLAVIDMSR